MDWGRLAGRTASFAFATWLAAQVGAGIEYSGSQSARALTVYLTTQCFAILFFIPLATWAWLDEEPSDLRIDLFAVLSVAIALLLTPWLLISDGIPALSISGFGGLLLSTAVIGAIVTRGMRTAGLAVLAMGGLWLVQALLPGAHQSGGGWLDTLATLAVLGVLCSVGGGNLAFWDGRGLPALWVPVVVPTTLIGLRLLVVTWLSTYLAVPLRFDGVWWFLLAVVILAVVTAPAWIGEQVRRRRLQKQAWQEVQAMQMHDNAVMGMTMMSAQSGLSWTDLAHRHRG